MPIIVEPRVSSIMAQSTLIHAIKWGRERERERSVCNGVLSTHVNCQVWTVHWKRIILNRLITIESVFLVGLEDVSHILSNRVGMKWTICNFDGWPCKKCHFTWAGCTPLDGWAKKCVLNCRTYISFGINCVQATMRDILRGNWINSYQLNGRR